MVSQSILDEIKQRLQQEHGPRLRGVILYGSEARNEARPDSDIDLLVLLDEPINYVHDVERSIEAVYPIAYQLGRRISTKPVSPGAYEQYSCPLYDAVKQEGRML